MKVKLFFIVSFSISVFFAYGASAIESQTPETEFKIVLCKDTPEVLSAWHLPIMFALNRAVEPYYTGNDLLRVQRRSCDESSFNATCFAANRIIQCDIKALERIFSAASWFVANYQDSGLVRYEEFRSKYTRAVLSAFKYADGTLKDNVSDEFLAKVRPLLEGENEGPVSNNQEELKAYSILYESIIDLNLSALLGHEVSHFYNDVCPIQEKSWVEKNGLLNHIRIQELRGKLFCERQPDVKEFKADVCALRRIRKLVDPAQEDILTQMQNPISDFASWLGATRV